MNGKTGAQWATEIFAEDMLAIDFLGVSIDLAEQDHAILSMDIKERHMSARAQVQGGTLFTLADFGFAVCAGYNNPVTVTLSADIKYMSAVKGKKLICEVNCIKDGRHACFYQANIRDELDTPVACVLIEGYRFDCHDDSEFPADAIDNPYKEQMYFHKA